MAVKKKTAEAESAAAGPVQANVPEYSKEQLLASAKIRNHRDLVDALLDERKKYTLETVEKLIEKYMKGQVK